MFRNIRNKMVVIEIKKSEKTNLLQKEQLLTRIFLTRNDERTVNNYKEIMQGFHDKKQASQYEILKALRKSGAIMDDIVKKLLKNEFLKQIGTRTAKRGGISNVPIYELTPYGLVLLGYLEDDIDTIMEGVKSSNDPFYTLELIALKEAPRKVILNSVYIWLESFNSSVENLLQIILAEMDKTPNQNSIALIRKKLSQQYELLDDGEKLLVFEYFCEMTRLKYLQKLRGQDLYQYFSDANQWGFEYIVYKCEKCGKNNPTTNPFETKKFCDKCANSTMQNPN
jgi:hypothetical protein